MGKMDDLQKKRARVEKEFLRAQSAYEKQAIIMKAKEQELKRIDADIVAALLVENNLTMADLTDLLADAKTQADTSTTDFSAVPTQTMFPVAEGA